MTRGVRALVVGVALATAACASSSQGRAPDRAVAPAAPTPPPPVVAAPAEPPRQADQLARIASELAELQNAVAKLMMGARQHDDQLIYLQRRLSDLEAQARGRAGALPPGFAPSAVAPSAAVPAPLPPPPVAPPAAIVAPPSAPLPAVAQPAPPAVAPQIAAARPAPPATRPAPPPPSMSAADELYQEGLEKFEAGDLDGAVVTLYDVVVNYPADPARERAQFLVGDIFLKQKDYRGAVAEFESLIAAVPSGSRVPDALLKLGTAQRALGDEARARRSWEKLVKDYPSSAAARSARTLLRAGR